jgi:FMN reductase
VRRIRILGLGGSRRPDSSSERALRIALSAAAAAEPGCDVTALGAEDLDLPFYLPDGASRSPAARRLVELVRACDGLVIASPAYHGSMSGLIKNALDHIEDLRDDERPYLDGRAVGCIATGAGWQATVMTLAALRSVVHALRGWPTPLGVAVNTTETAFDAGGGCRSAAVAQKLELVGRQVAGFALRTRV